MVIPDLQVIDTPSAVPPSRVSRICIGRLHNLGNYEHVRYEITADIPPDGDAGATLQDLDGLLRELCSKEPHAGYELTNAHHVLNSEITDRGSVTLRDLDKAKEVISSNNAWNNRRKTLLARLNTLGGSTEYVDAKELWDIMP